MRGADFKLLLFQDYGTSITDGRETVGRSEGGGFQARIEHAITDPPQQGRLM